VNKKKIKGRTNWAGSQGAKRVYLHQEGMPKRAARGEGNISSETCSSNELRETQGPQRTTPKEEGEEKGFGTKEGNAVQPFLRCVRKGGEGGISLNKEETNSEMGKSGDSAFRGGGPEGGKISRIKEKKQKSCEQREGKAMKKTGGERSKP